MKIKLYLLLVLFGYNFLMVNAQTVYPVVQELLPILDKVPSLDITLSKANKSSACGEACCTENTIKNLLTTLDKIKSDRKTAPVNKESKKFNLSDINVADVGNLDLKSGATALAKNTVKVLDSNPSMLSGKTIKVLDSNPAMLGNKNIKVLDSNPSMLANKKSTKSLDTNPSMLSNPASKTTTTSNTEKTTNTTNNNTTNEISPELDRLLKDESEFRDKINADWETIQKEYNIELDKLLLQKKSIENNADLDAKTKEKQLKELAKKSSIFYDGFMLNKANPLLKQQKLDVDNRYSYIEILIKQSNYGIEDTSLYTSINNAQDTILELIEALGVYSSDCIAAGCQLNQQIR